MKRPLVELGLGRAARRHGIALILTLGILSLLLLTCLAFAFSSQLDRTTSRVRGEQTRAGLLADAALQRVLGFMAREFAGVPYPSNLFLQPSDGSDWEATPVLFSWRPQAPSGIETQWVPFAYGAATNHDSTWGGNYGIDDALQVTLAGGGYTPLLAAGHQLAAHVSFIPVIMPRQIQEGGTASGDSIIGRYAYLIRDHTGQLDPNWVTTPGSSEGSDSTGDGDGSDIRAINLRHTGMNGTLADQLGQGLGNPDVLPWLGYQHIFKALASARTNNVDLIANAFPHTLPDRQEYWTRADASDTWPSIFRQRVDLLEIGGGLGVPELYNEFLGYHAGNTGYDTSDTTILSPWLRNVNPDITFPDANHRRDWYYRAAAQLAVNMVDYATGGSDPTVYGINPATGALTAATVGNSRNHDLAVVGHKEGRLGLAEFAFRLQAQAVDAGDSNLELRLTPAFKVDIFTPYAASSSTNRPQVVFHCRLVAESTPAETFTVTVAPGSFDAAVTRNNGRLWSTPAWVAGPTRVYSDYVTPSDPKFTITEFTVTHVEVHQPGLHQVVPPHNVRLFTWRSDPTDIDTAAVKPLYGVLAARDPLFNSRGAEDVDFDRFWTTEQELVWDTGSFDFIEMSAGATDTGIGSARYVVYDGGSTLSDVGVGYVGSTGGSEPNNYVHPYEGLDTGVKNAAFARLHELGRVQSPHTPNRSVRLWMSSGGDDHLVDAHLLDMFQIGTEPRRGTVNLNSQFSGPLLALFEEVFRTNTAAEARNALWGINGATGGTPLMYRGDIFRMFAALGYSAASDAEAEEDLGKFIEFTQVRDQYYTVITAVQMLRDLGTRDPGSLDNRIIWRNDGASNHYALVYGQRQEMIMLYRDGWTGRVKILRRDILQGE